MHTPPPTPRRPTEEPESMGSAGHGCYARSVNQIVSTRSYAGGIAKGIWLVQNRQKVFVGLAFVSLLGLGTVVYIASRRGR